MNRLFISIMLLISVILTSGCDLLEYRDKYNAAKEKLDRVEAELVMAKSKITELSSFNIDQNSDNSANEMKRRINDLEEQISVSDDRVKEMQQRIIYLERQNDVLSESNQLMAEEAENTGFKREIKSLKSMLNISKEPGY